MTTYTVVEGDSLSKIARDVLGNVNLWPEIAKLNNINQVDLIFPGQLLKLPDLSGKTVSTTTSPKAEAKAGMGIGWIVLILIAGGAAYKYYKDKKKKQS